MQLPSHLFLSYFVYQTAFGQNQKYLIPFLAAAVIIDLDHGFLFKKNISADKKIILDSRWRTRLHELDGLILFSIVAVFIWFFNSLLAQVLILGLLLHYVIDFLTGEIRPFYPYSNTKIQIFFKKNKQGLVELEILFFILLIVLILWKLLLK